MDQYLVFFLCFSLTAVLCDLLHKVGQAGRVRGGVRLDKEQGVAERERETE